MSKLALREGWKIQPVSARNGNPAYFNLRYQGRCVAKHLSADDLAQLETTRPAAFKGAQLPSRTPDTDYYHTEVMEVTEEEE